MSRSRLPRHVAAIRAARDSSRASSSVIGIAARVSAIEDARRPQVADRDQAVAEVDEPFVLPCALLGDELRAMASVACLLRAGRSLYRLAADGARQRPRC